jgi:ATP-binding cassette subfamily B protein
VPPYLLGVAIDAFFTGGRDLSLVFVPQSWIPATTKGQFLFVFGVFLGVSVLNMATHAVRFLSWRWFQQSVLYDLRIDAYDATQRLGIEFFETEQTGDVMSVLNNDINELEGLVGGWVRSVLQNVVTIVGLTVVMVALHWQLAVVTVALVPPILGISYVYQQYVEPRYDAKRGAVGSLNAHIQNNVSGIETVKSFTNEAYEFDQIAESSREYWRTDWDVARLAGVFYPVRSFLNRTTVLAIFLVGGWWALFGAPFGLAGPLSAGTFVTFYLYGRRFVRRMTSLGNIIDQYTRAKASAKRVFGLMHHPTTVSESADALERLSAEGVVDEGESGWRLGDEQTVQGFKSRVQNRWVRERP